MFLNLIVEGEKKLHTKDTFESASEKWTNSGSYSARYLPVPDQAIALRDVYCGNVRLNEAKHNDINALGGSNYLVKGNKVWFGFIPQTITMNFDQISLDADGIPMVNENHVNALAWYIIFHLDYAEYRKGNSNRSVMKDSEERKDQAFRQARGSDNMVDHKETRIINENLMRLYSPQKFSSIYGASFNTDLVVTNKTAE